MRWLLASAVLLALGMVASGVIAGRTLRERDAAVREGLLLRAAHAVERELREGGPEAAPAALQSLVDRGTVSAIALLTDGEVLQRAGTPSGAPVETALFLGPGWRGFARRGMGAGEPGAGPGLGLRGGQPPFHLRLWPAAGTGDSSRIATLTTWGSLAAALALLAFAAAAARGVEARNRAASLDAERSRLEVVSAAGAGLAHRIRNPLATIKGTAQILQSQLPDAQRDRAARIVDASARIESLVEELLTFARPIEVHAERIDLSEVAGHVVPTVRGEAVVAHADREHVTAALEELVTNAQHAGDPHPEVSVRRQGRHAVIEVRDRGTGLQLPPSRAFEPYVTSRADGTGLGLPTIRALIRANGGDVTLTDREGGGCVATIVLPESPA